MSENEERPQGQQHEDGTPWENAVEREHQDDKPSQRARERDEKRLENFEEKQEHAEAVNEKELPSRAAAVHERLRIDGDKELERDAMALLWSAIAAGISMSASMMARGLLHAHLPESNVGFLVESMGYTLGFLIVILARQQLFTENTVTAVLPFMSHPTLNSLGRLLRLWGVVLVGNVFGAGLAAFTFLHLPMFSPEVSDAFVRIGEKVMENDPMSMFAKSIVAGWLIATMVWVLPAADQAKSWIILIMTYAVAIGEFPHIIVGASEILYLVFAGKLPWIDFFLHFGLPTLAGNIIGGTFIFALISHAQIRNDMDLQRHGRRGAWMFKHGPGGKRK
ncbi:formate/nitrite transporter family protein [Alloalcanivorax mobilis]|mgnify:FL=1|uniref:formate/nitrite transporter family protein n=1 Tax=Alloalcanivorax mobilis TaxID=2019569 RepID=UPI001E5952FE|nr:formate/nitrite transporter family protein [Alloalcanivorax mobilis]